MHRIHFRAARIGAACSSDSQIWKIQLARNSAGRLNAARRPVMVKNEKVSATAARLAGRNHAVGPPARMLIWTALNEASAAATPANAPKKRRCRAVRRMVLLMK